ncbi:DNA repair protein UVH3 isoform X2 [Tripterygium wilfordii]|uniref:DNA repair protein UVH3 isoform X2 n=2 Tax=Tripterygium wilfordii TaxID=458696 RepID=UPI0018F7F5D1|nr:DNA repair protein UVH3 isoform X2 [Tripterygium wilfordii]
MGVHGLWELLSPVGRRVSVETLAGKKLAIDASIWMVQFMKAMRDEKGEMVRNAHLLGFFRRICKLLYLRTKPVFVFDGGTPALKRRTVIARRRQRENAQAKIRKTAEKLLLNHLKAMRLKELAKNLEDQRDKQKHDARGNKVVSDQSHMEGSYLESNNEVYQNYNREELDEMLAATLAAESDRSLVRNGSTSAAIAPPIDASEEDEEMILPELHEDMDPTVLASLPLSVQRDFHAKLNEMKQIRAVELIKNKEKEPDNDAGVKKSLSTQSNVEGFDLERNNVISRSYSQNKLDEMLAASIAAEEDDSLTNNASTSAAAIFPEEDNDSYEDEEMILPVMHGKVDPAVLAALPPSMQLDLLVQMREGLMAENRQRYQKVKKAPEKFSELQIQSYLKTVAFRREIDEVQKAAAGRGVGGVQTSRIASEANREFIFSSTFSGDKQVLASAGKEANGDKRERTPTDCSGSNSMNRDASISRSDTVAGSVLDESRRHLDDNIETYLDELGRIRVSRVRAMGIRMTRDLQRNLDLMKEVELQQTNANGVVSSESELETNNVGVPNCYSKDKVIESSYVGNADSGNLNKKDEPSILKNGGCIEISFEDDCEHGCSDGDDDIFAGLVGGRPLTISSLDNNPIRKRSTESASDGNQEERFVEGRHNMSFNDIEATNKHSPREGNISDESEVEWEDGACEVPKNSSPPRVPEETVSKGYLEEEAELQEAIKRSLKDLACAEVNNTVCELGPPKHSKGNAGGVEKPDMGQVCMSQSIALPQKQNSDTGEQYYQRGKMPFGESVAALEAKENNLILEQFSSAQGSELFASGSKCLGNDSYASTAVFHDISDSIMVDEKESDMVSETSTFVDSRKVNSDAGTSSHLTEVPKPSVSLLGPAAKDSEIAVIVEQNVPAEKDCDHHFNEREHNIHRFSLLDNETMHVDGSRASLEKEMLLLDSERVNLGNEQRQLERNAESVSSEMFAECQELLQMFGLPYIIAPMEAEAQCAYLELANLVDGVVTDDSDVFLFGAQSVYKNIFDDRKYVETYFMKDIEKELGLTREKLIRMALLLGSDYTEGISGIGIVNAIEVINAFPEEDGLQNFRDWIESPDPAILRKYNAQTGSSARKRGSKVGEDSSNSANNSMEGLGSVEHKASQNHEQKLCVDHVEETKQIFIDKHRNLSKNWHIPSSFPNEAVISAYNLPQVDKSTDAFSWGKLDVLVLRKLCWEKFGWASQKSDDLLLPVLKEYNKHETQLRMEAFYTFNERFAKIRSKRITKAVKGITRSQTSMMTEDAKQDTSKQRKRKKVVGDDKSEKCSKGTEDLVAGNDNSSLEKSVPKRSRKRKITGQPVLAEGEILEQSIFTEGRERTSIGSRGNVRGKGFRGGSGRGKGRGRGRGILNVELSVSSSGDGSSDDEQAVHVRQSEEPPLVRRSARLRNPVNYVNIDDLDKLVDNGDKRSFDKFDVEQDSSWSRGMCGKATEDLGIEKQMKAKDPSLVEGWCGDSLEREGSFQMVEGEMGGLGESQDNNPHEAEVSEDYLKMGGGFCIDEKDADKDYDVCSPAAASDFETAESLRSSGFVEDANTGGLIQSTSSKIDRVQDGGKTNAFVVDFSNATIDSESYKDGASLQESAGFGTKTSTVGLSAMPSLRRKRRGVDI